MYARAWESDFGEPIFGNDQDDPSSSTPHEVTVESSLKNAETCSTPAGTTQQYLPETFLQIYGFYDKTDTDHYMSHEMETTSEQLNLNASKPTSTKYELCHNP